MPAETNAWIISLELVAGPSVHTIFALRIYRSVHPALGPRRESARVFKDLWCVCACGTLGRMLLRQGLSCFLLVSLCCVGCAYPRRTTPLSTVSEDKAKTAVAPPNLWRFVLVRADIPPQKRSGMSWDDDSGPDPFLKLLVDGKVRWESPVLENNIHPVFDASTPRNFDFPHTSRIRFELWDKDGVTADPIGMYEGRALGEAIVGAHTTIKLEGGATLTVKVAKPAPHVGSGIASYELRKRALVVLKVIASSPAARAGLKPGDHITSIDGKMIDELGPGQAESAMTLAGQNGSELTVQSNGAYRQVKLDDGYVWLTM